MTGLKFNETLAKIHFWGMFVFFNLHVRARCSPPACWACRGACRRTRRGCRAINDFVSISAFLLGLSMLVFLVNLVYSMLIARVPAEANPWQFAGARVPAAHARAGERTSSARR